jgi:ubiquinone/menaquinone biosynthesis C-methylase UbiE
MCSSISLVCPYTHDPLHAEGDAWVTHDGKTRYPVVDGIPNCVYPPRLGTDDERWSKFYDLFAPFYAWSERSLGGLVTGLDIVEVRRDMMRLVPGGPGERILEVSPGPGTYQPDLAAKVGGQGCIWALDISRGMLKQCRKACALQSPGPQLVQGNAAYLPFEDGCFDGLFHFGGVNLFSEPDRALREFARVVKRGGWVAYGDEQFSQKWRQRTDLRAKILRRGNPGYLREPPAIPPLLDSVERYEVQGGLCYLNVCRVAA